MKKYEIWVADLNPQRGTEPGKTRPVVIVQTNFLNGHHPSTIICPLTTITRTGATLLRIHLTAGTAGLTQDSDIMLDQLRAIDNRRLLQKIGSLPAALHTQVNENLKIVLDLS
ncbi:MAG: type II toxin-antitoxin system PemK/MazF family toxin [Saprospiraceae bacterium]|nr:type II toxin-antitoxin system PemK/MazF family toxin [Saprospiraceae bacterium]